MTSQAANQNIITSSALCFLAVVFDHCFTSQVTMSWYHDLLPWSSNENEMKHNWT